MKPLMQTVLILVLLVGVNAHAAKRKKAPRPDPDADRVMTVVVPKAQITLAPVPEFKPPMTEYEVSTSTWVPHNFERGGYTGARSAFSAAGLPYISIDRISELARLGSDFILSSKIGLSYLGMERSSQSYLGNVSEGTVTQHLSLFMARLALELEWANALPWGLQPNFSVGILPSWATAETSAYEESASGFGVPLEASLGLLWRSGTRLSTNRGAMSLGVSGQLINGAVAGSSVTGAGVRGEFRISI